MDDEQTFELQIEYAKGVLANVQELIRFMDQKGSYVVAICIFFVSSFFSILQVYAGGKGGVEGYLIFALGIWYITHTAASVWNAIMTTRPRQPRVEDVPNSPGIGFPARILATYKSSSVAYLESLKHVQPQGLLADLAEQIMASSQVYADKAHHVELAVRQLLWSAIPWFAAVVVAVASLGLPAFAARTDVVLLVGVVAVLFGVYILRGYPSATRTRDR
jgi:hypothetical protein